MSTLHESRHEREINNAIDEAVARERNIHQRALASAIDAAVNAERERWKAFAGTAAELIETAQIVDERFFYGLNVKKEQWGRFREAALAAYDAEKGKQ